MLAGVLVLMCTAECSVLLLELILRSLSVVNGFNLIIVVERKRNAHWV